MLSTTQQQFKLKSYREQRKALAEMIADDGAHYSNVCEIWKAFGSIMLATEDATIEEQIASGEAEVVLNKASQMSKLELFLREEHAEERLDYGVFRDRIAALTEMFGQKLDSLSENLTIWAIHKICAKIDDEETRTCKGCEDVVSNATKLSIAQLCESCQEHIDD